ncbi:hypothetical protein EK904_009569 [Melospiza melodia maxima]|nr:hypothetical protein EK904_009569 [Melospiza melodia maxima]
MHSFFVPTGMFSVSSIAYDNNSVHVYWKKCIDSTLFKERLLTAERMDCCAFNPALPASLLKQ